MVAHETLKRLEREPSLTEQAKSLVETLHFWSRFQQLNKALEIVKIQKIAALHISLLHDLSAHRKQKDKGSKYLEVTIQVVPRRVDVEPFAELLNVLEAHFLLRLLVGSLPTLLRPEGLAEVEVSEPAHEGLAYSVQFMKGRIPHMKNVDRGGYDMPYFPATVEGVYNSKPPILALLRYLEQLSVVSGV